MAKPTNEQHIHTIRTELLRDMKGRNVILSDDIIDQLVDLTKKYQDDTYEHSTRFYEVHDMTAEECVKWDDQRSLLYGSEFHALVGDDAYTKLFGESYESMKASSGFKIIDVEALENAYQQSLLRKK